MRADPDAAEEQAERMAGILEARYDARRAATRRRLGVGTKIPARATSPSTDPQGEPT